MTVNFRFAGTTTGKDYWKVECYGASGRWVSKGGGWKQHMLSGEDQDSGVRLIVSKSQ